MTIAFTCVLIASILPIIWVGVAKASIGFSLGKNLNPREHLANATGKAQRANWAQQNAWEAFAPFAAAVIIASHIGVRQSYIDYCAVTFIVMRITHGISYIYNNGNLRSIVWSIGMFSVFGLYILAWIK